MDESGLRERVKVDPAPGAGAGAGGAGGGESVAQRRDTRLYSRTRAQAGKRPSTHLNYCPLPRLPPATRHYTIDPLHAIEPTPLSSAGQESETMQLDSLWHEGNIFFGGLLAFILSISFDHR